MKIYLDDDSANPILAKHLINDGHEVTLPANVSMSGKADAAHFMLAIEKQHCLLSHNHHDFELLHKLVLLVGGHHPGILIVRRDNDARRDMLPKAIARALRKLLASGLPIQDELYVLNHWR